MQGFLKMSPLKHSEIEKQLLTNIDLVISSLANKISDQPTASTTKNLLSLQSCIFNLHQEVKDLNAESIQTQICEYHRKIAKIISAQNEYIAKIEQLEQKFTKQ